MWHETTITLCFLKSVDDTDVQQSWQEASELIWAMKGNPAIRAGCYLFSSLLCFVFTRCEWRSVRPALRRYCVRRVFFFWGGGGALFCLLTALLPVLGLADAEVSPRWLIVYGHLSAWPPVCHVATCYGDLGLWGGSAKKKNGGGGLERWGKGRLAGAWASSAVSVWTAVLSCRTRITASRGLTGLGARLPLSAACGVASRREMKSRGRLLRQPKTESRGWLRESLCFWQ